MDITTLNVYFPSGLYGLDGFRLDWDRGLDFHSLHNSTATSFPYLLCSRTCDGIVHCDVHISVHVSGSFIICSWMVFLVDLSIGMRSVGGFVNLLTTSNIHYLRPVDLAHSFPNALATGLTPESALRSCAVHPANLLDLEAKTIMDALAAFERATKFATHDAEPRGTSVLDEVGQHQDRDMKISVEGNMHWSGGWCRSQDVLRSFLDRFGAAAFNLWRLTFQSKKTDVHVVLPFPTEETCVNASSDNVAIIGIYISAPD